VPVGRCGVAGTGVSTVVVADSAKDIGSLSGGFGCRDR
jgi:hypothetical protein